MAQEDIIQVQDIAWIDIDIAGGAPTVVAKNGPISGAAVGGSGVDITLTQGIPDAKLMLAFTAYKGATGAGGMASISLDAATSTDTVKRIIVYGDNQAAPITTWAGRIIFSRVY